MPAGSGDGSGVADLGMEGVRDDHHTGQGAEQGRTWSSSGVNAGISLDFAAIWTWARTTPVAVS